MTAHDRRLAAVVTGGTRGIGLGIAQALAHEGWDLAIGGVRAVEEVEGTLDALRSRGGHVHYVQGDVAIASARAQLLDVVRREFGVPAALVNNAGRAPRVRADLLDATEDSFVEVMRTNLKGPYFLAQAIARDMVAAGPSPHPRAIVFITSVSAEMASPNRGEYCVSKAGLAMAAQLFATHLAPHGIAVYDVRPGIIATDMTAAVKDKYDQRIADGLVPAGRWGTPDDVGRAVAALLRGDLPYATGSIIHIDGGLTIPRL
jgi:NAD(P)-dependent dehydrogenase (short-subunit alcohol dehydrogenase family)